MGLPQFSAVDVVGACDRLLYQSVDQPYPHLLRKNLDQILRLGPVRSQEERLEVRLLETCRALPLRLGHGLEGLGHILEGQFLLEECRLAPLRQHLLDYLAEVPVSEVDAAQLPRREARQLLHGIGYGRVPYVCLVHAALHGGPSRREPGRTFCVIGVELAEVLRKDPHLLVLPRRRADLVEGGSELREAAHVPIRGVLPSCTQTRRLCSTRGACCLS